MPRIWRVGDTWIPKAGDIIVGRCVADYQPITCRGFCVTDCPFWSLSKTKWRKETGDDQQIERSKKPARQV